MTPCLERCGRRTLTKEDSLCSVCKMDVAHLEDRVAYLNARFSDTPFECCATLGCDHFVDGYQLCALCSTSCFPCSTDGCRRRAAPENGGKCAHCNGLTFAPRRKGTSSTTPSPCAFSIVGCKNVASFSLPHARAVCSMCYKSGFPCRYASSGCGNTLSFKQASVSDTCAFCIKSGPPCVGADGSGCKNPRDRHGKRYCRRSAEDNHNCCILCRPAFCKIGACPKPVHSSFWTDQLCYGHGRAVVSSSARELTPSSMSCTNDNNDTGLTHPSSAKSFVDRVKQKLQATVQEPCVINGCPRSAQCFQPSFYFRKIVFGKDLISKLLSFQHGFLSRLILLIYERLFNVPPLVRLLTACRFYTFLDQLV